MRGCKRGGKQQEIDEYIAVSWMIISSGFVVLNYIYMIPSMFILLAIAFLFIWRYRGISKYNMRMLAFLLYFVLINETVTLVIKPYPLELNSLIILGIRLFSLAIIVSNITINSFSKKYLNVMCIIAAISLLCFMLVTYASVKLPFSGNYGDPTYYGTFYFQSKQNSINITRNTGPYSEAGMFAISLIIALAILLFTEKNLLRGRNFVKITLLTLALLTTQSGTGLVCYVILLAVYAIKNGLSYKVMKNPSILIIIIFLGIGLYYVETNSGILNNKVLDQGGSYDVRMNDTWEGYRIAKENFFFGTGIANNNENAWNAMLEGSRSNGMANFAAFCGIPLTLFYVFRLYKQSRLFTHKKLLYTIAFFAVLIVIYNTQPVVIQTIGLSFFFNWKREMVKEVSV